VKDKRVGYLLRVILIFIAYFATARIGLTLNAVNGFATLVWAPSGIALAALLIFGYRYWPGVFLAAFLINFVTGASLFVALAIGVGNTLEPLLGVYLLKQIGQFRRQLERVSDVISLLVLAALLSTAVSAMVGVSSLWLSGTVSAAAFASTWLAWWVGDMLGVLVAAPFILVWSTKKRTKLRPKQIAEAVIYATVLVGVSVIAFRGSQPLGIKPFTLAYVIFPILIWIALRFGQAGSVTATLGASLVAIWGTVVSFHPSATNTLSHRLLLLQSFIGISAVTFMTMAAVVAERERNQRQQIEMAQRTASLTQQRSRLLVLNQAKDEFISLASHQLRTPATSVKQYIGMLLEGYAGRLTKSQRKMLEVAYDSNERQLGVIDSILRVAQIDTGKIALKKEPVDLTKLVTEVLEGRASTIASRNQQVEFFPSNRNFVATIDKDKIKAALDNIIDNASKYSPPGKKLEVTLKRNKDTIAISVKDDGVGIVKKDAGKLFKKFSRIDNPLSVAANGTGLGLYWAKKVVDLHQGSISVKTTPNRGSTFTVKLTDPKV